jgi:hypothetical protein
VLVIWPAETKWNGAEFQAGLVRPHELKHFLGEMHGKLAFELRAQAFASFKPWHCLIGLYNWRECVDGDFDAISNWLETFFLRIEGKGDAGCILGSDNLNKHPKSMRGDMPRRVVSKLNACPQVEKE